MDWKLELVAIPVTDVERAKHFYADQVGFHLDYDQTVDEKIRFVQMTPPGSACSIAFGNGLTTSTPGSVQGMQLVVSDIETAYRELSQRGVDVTTIEDFPWGRFVYFSDPDGNRWSVQQVPVRR